MVYIYVIVKAKVSRFRFIRCASVGVKKRRFSFFCRFGLTARMPSTTNFRLSTRAAFKSFPVLDAVEGVPSSGVKIGTWRSSRFTLSFGTEKISVISQIRWVRLMQLRRGEKRKSVCEREKGRYWEIRRSEMLEWNGRTRITTWHQREVSHFKRRLVSCHKYFPQVTKRFRDFRL